jgi:hypothetical protein
MVDKSDVTVRKLRGAKRLLESAGYIVTRLPRYRPRILDQCEYPDRLARPGECCIHQTSRVRKTPFGTMFLCGDHFRAPLIELIDERVSR